MFFYEYDHPSDLPDSDYNYPGNDESEPESDASEDAIQEGQDPTKVYLADALHYALETEDFERAKILIDYGADVNADSSTTDTPFRHIGQYPLEIAAEKNNPEMFEYLLSHGADPKILWTLLMEDDYVDSLTFFAKHPRLFKVILENVPQQKFTGEEKYNFDNLIRSVIRLEKGNVADGNIEVLQMLLELQPTCDINLLRADSNEGEFGDTLLSCAVSCQSLRFVKLIVKLGTAITTEGGPSNAYLPLHEACNSHSGISSYCIPLHEASSNDDVETVMFLLEHGDMCIKSSDGLLPIDLAYRKLARNTLRFFLLNGFSSESIERNKLHVACFLEDVALVMKLIKDGADVNALDDDGRAPLVIAIKVMNPYLIKLLLRSGADPEVEGKNFSPSAIVAAVKEGSANILDVLLNAYHGKIDLNDPKHNLLKIAVAAENQDTFHRLLELGVDVCQHGKGDPAGLRPIHKASELGNYQMLKALIERGAGVNDMVDWGEGVVSSYKRTPLAMCRDRDCIRLLLDFGAEMYYRGMLGKGYGRLFQPCFMALTEGLGDVEIMRAYWDKDGANLAHDFSIFNLACMKGYHELIKFLLLKNPGWKTECHKLTFFSSHPKEFHMFNNTVKLLLDLGCTFNFSSNAVNAGKFLYPDLSRTEVGSRDDKEWFGTQFYYHQVFAFTKLVQERCGHNDCLDGHGLISLLTRTKDHNMIMLLRDCGHKVLGPTFPRKARLIHKVDRNNFLDRIEQICQNPITLQNRCRIQIRRTLFAFIPENCHIDQAIQKLPLPNCLLEFLSFTGDHEYQYLKYC